GGFVAFDRPAGHVYVPDAQLTGSPWGTAALEAAARRAAVVPVGAGATVYVGGFMLEVLAPESGAPGDQPGAAYLGLRVVAPSGRSLCAHSARAIDAQPAAAARRVGPCPSVLPPSGARSLLSPDIERSAVTPTTQ